MIKIKYHKTVLISIMLLASISATSFAQKKTDTSKMIYLPVYSSIYHGDKNRELDLAITVNLRNMDPNNNITVYSVDYFNKSGNLVRNYLSSSIILKPYETVNYIVNESDTHGGSSATFIVKWDSNVKANDLLVEAVMIGTYPQGISFVTRGIIIKK